MKMPSLRHARRLDVWASTLRRALRASAARIARTTVAAFVLVALLVPVSARAATYWTVATVMKSFFPSSKKVTFKRISLSDADAADIGKRLGVAPVKRDWVIYFGETDGRRDGYAIVDEEKGMHYPIDFAVRFNAGGAVERVEVMVYREAYGDEIRSPRFRTQFDGKTGADAITAGKDIDVVSGASISCRSMATGVKRDVLVVQAAMKGHAL